MGKSVLIEKHSRGNIENLASGVDVGVDGGAVSGIILKFLT